MAAAGSSRAPPRFGVCVPSVVTRAGSPTLYRIQVTDIDCLSAERESWIIEKRYSQLLAFHQALVRYIKTRNSTARRNSLRSGSGGVGPWLATLLPAFPPKKLLRNADPIFIEARRAALESYLMQLCARDELASIGFVRWFLQRPNHVASLLLRLRSTRTNAGARLRLEQSTAKLTRLARAVADASEFAARTGVAESEAGREVYGSALARLVDVAADVDALRESPLLRGDASMSASLIAEAETARRLASAAHESATRSAAAAPPSATAAPPWPVNLEPLAGEGTAAWLARCATAGAAPVDRAALASWLVASSWPPPPHVLGYALPLLLGVTAAPARERFERAWRAAAAAASEGSPRRSDTELLAAYLKADLPRTFPEAAWFQHAWTHAAVSDIVTGWMAEQGAAAAYGQGLASLAGLCLVAVALQYCPPEAGGFDAMWGAQPSAQLQSADVAGAVRAEAYACFAALAGRLASLFAPGGGGSGSGGGDGAGDGSGLRDLVNGALATVHQLRLPLSRHLARLQLDAIVIVYRWFSCLFAWELEPLHALVFLVFLACGPSDAASRELLQSAAALHLLAYGRELMMLSDEMQVLMAFAKPRPMAPARLTEWLRETWLCWLAREALVDPLQRPAV